VISLPTLEYALPDLCGETGNRDKSAKGKQASLAISLVLHLAMAYAWL
jgi:hypothetical protein